MPSNATLPEAVGRLRQQPHDGQRRHRLAGTGFADKTHDFACLDRQVDVLQDRLVADGKRQSFDFEQAHRWRRSFGSSVSLMPSPIRLRPSTVMTMAMPGTIAR